MPFQPADTLKSRTFLGLILCQFLAAFNDQCIHASAMFFAIHQHTLAEATAISLMPILFFAPWAIFCTLAGYFADRFSKRNSLVFWKVAEVGITLVALTGFTLGSMQPEPSPLGPWIVLSTVFLMGLHSAFFVPAKYGVMPEILSPSQLSNGNGVLESTSFLAVILGTVTGGILSSTFRHEEYWIGFILVGLAVLGVFFSLLIRPMPAANPSRPFPLNPFKPLVENMRTMLRSRPLVLAVLGIAFFTFMVAFMRATMYMHGESQNPRWDEFKTSLVVAAVALGVGLGSPLAGILSRGKIELGLVPIGAIGMILACLGAAIVLFHLSALVVCLIAIGFFSGFYIVPLYTLLQHRAPKTSKGDFIATSNFINVTGAITASLLFFFLVFLAKAVGVAKPVPQTDILTGKLEKLQFKHGSTPVYFVVKHDGTRRRRFGHVLPQLDEELGQFADEESGRPAGHAVFLTVEPNLKVGDTVTVSKYLLRDSTHYELRRAGTELHDAYDQAFVPRFLFVGAGLMTLGILILLWRQLPDFFLRSLLWAHARGKSRPQLIGLHHVPSNGPVILATNCDSIESCMHVITATDRYTSFLLLKEEATSEPQRLVRALAQRTLLLAEHPEVMTLETWTRAYAAGVHSLERGDLLGVTVEGKIPLAETDKLLSELRARTAAVVLPVYCCTLDGMARVVIGEPIRGDVSTEQVRELVRGLSKAND